VRQGLQNAQGGRSVDGAALCLGLVPPGDLLAVHAIPALRDASQQFRPRLRAFPQPVQRPQTQFQISALPMPSHNLGRVDLRMGRVDGAVGRRLTGHSKKREKRLFWAQEGGFLPKKRPKSGVCSYWFVNITKMQGHKYT